MKNRFYLLSKVVGLVVFYSLVLIASVFLTMSLLIKGEELATPDFVGKPLKDAYDIASEYSIYLKKIEVDYDKSFPPLTVINQAPVAGANIKTRSIVEVYVNSELIEVTVPDLRTLTLKKAEELLEKNDLKKRYISYIEADNVPIDVVIAQSFAPGCKFFRGNEIDLLVSSGKRETGYLMPGIIGLRADRVVVFFENRGLKVSKITEVDYYPGFKRGIVVNQSPAPGFRVTASNLISLEVTK